MNLNRPQTILNLIAQPANRAASALSKAFNNVLVNAFVADRVGHFHTDYGSSGRGSKIMCKRLMGKLKYQPTLRPPVDFYSLSNLRLSLLLLVVICGALFGNATTAALGQSTAPVQDEHAPSDPALPVLDKINTIRRLAGLQPVELDEALSRACRLHAQYLVTNRADPKAQGLGAHTERQELPGYTSEGERVARTSNICWGKDVAGAIDLWMAGLYHRIPLLRPNLKRIGLGSEGDIVVADVVSGVGEFNLNAIPYPADGQSNVPTEFGVDMPDPLPKEAPRNAGYPITLLFPFVSKIAGVEAELIDSAGTKIEFHLSDPERPATSFPQQSTICLIPTKPLAANTTYKVSIKANVDGWVVRKSWSFLTREAQIRK